MIATMVLIPLDGSGVIHKRYNWNDTLPCPTQANSERVVQVSKISLFGDVPVIGSIPCHIASMYSE